LPIALCLVAGVAALAGLSSAVISLLFEIGPAGLIATSGFGLLAVGASIGGVCLALRSRTG
jgi:hypothetical protein